MEIDWKVVLGECTTQVLKIVLPFLVALVLKWGAELWMKIQKEQPELSSILSYAAYMAVSAAEQVFGSGHGEEKKEYAIQAMQNYLAERNISVKVSVIIDAIESAVFNTLNDGMTKDKDGNTGAES